MNKDDILELFLVIVGSLFILAMTAGVFVVFAYVLDFIAHLF